MAIAPVTAPAAERARRRRQRAGERLRAVSRGDLLALCWLVLLVLCFLSPALKDGPSLAPADLGRGLSWLTSLPHAAPNHNVIDGDQIDQFIPWNTLDWRLVRGGELPLWNDLSGTGLPQLANFQSAAFALPSLVGYLFPLSLSFLVTVAFKLLVAGTGAYVCCRLLGCRPVAAALGATTAMLSGNFAGWLGWAQSGTFAWAGWVLAASILCVRSRGAWRHVGLLAAVSAFAVYGGFPEGLPLVALALGVVLLAGGALTVLEHRRVELLGVGRLAVGLLLGAALSAPAWLPGLQVLSASARAGKQADVGLSWHAVTLLLAQGYDGLPIRGSYWFGPADYYETAAYVGVIAVVLALFAVVRSLRRPAVAGLALGGVVCLALVYRLDGFSPVQHLVGHLGLSSVAVQRALAIVGFLVAVLAALGAEQLLARWREGSSWAAYLACCAAVAAVLVAMWLGVGAATMPAADAVQYSRDEPSHATLVSLREASLSWPSATLLALVVLGFGVAAIARAQRRELRRRAERGRRGALRRQALVARWAIGGGLLAAQSAFLLFAGVGLNSYAATAYPVTASLAEVRSIVGTSLLGIDAANTGCPPSGPQVVCGVRMWKEIGIYPEMNIAYGIDELAMHDPTIPQATFDNWPVPNADQHFAGNLNLFVPSVDTVALAQRYGVSYVLAGPGRPAPPGMVKVAAVAASSGKASQSMTLYAVPGSSRFSFAGAPPGDAVVSVRHRGDAAYDLSLRTATAATLVLRVTDSPGWRATANGRPVALADDDGMLSAAVPARTTSFVLRYWPSRLTIGFGLALGALALLALGGAAGWWRRRGAAPSAGRRPGVDSPPRPPDGDGPPPRESDDGALVPSTGGTARES